MGMILHFMSQDLPSQPPEISNQITYPFDFLHDQRKTPPAIALLPAIP